MNISNITKDFALTFLGSKFGEAGSCSDDCAAFSHDSIQANPDGSIPFAACLEYGDDGRVSIWINDDLPSDLLLQIYGYAVLNTIKILNLDADLPTNNLMR